ncbi:MAG: Carbohydrate-selective porin OprB [Caulobacteraceae bacterium]|nr:Carbohydrate-selective porin OprB [Caulobacteraceae bacterium]
MTCKTSMSSARQALGLMIGLAILGAASRVAAAETRPAFTWEATYTADVQAVAGDEAWAGRALDNLELVGDLDLQQAVGWPDLTLHAALLNNAGGAPNGLAATLQGVDNIEVTRPGARLFELWLEKDLGHASLRAGLYDLNSEFYVDDAASQLIAPAFGIGSELAATGPNGPSIFPSTGLGVRLNLELANQAYLRGAVINARSAVIGDPGGVDWSFDDGVLGIAEIGRDGPKRLALCLWGYSERQDDIRDVRPSGAPRSRIASGAYLLAEHPLFEDATGRGATAFVRLGFSDGATTPFRGGWQAGVQVSQLLASRPNSTLSVGLQGGVLDRRFRANLRDGGTSPASAETGLEFTYSDRLAGRLTIQPDLQWIHHAGGDAARDDLWLAALRISLAFGPGGGE